MVGDGGWSMMPRRSAAESCSPTSWARLVSSSSSIGRLEREI